MKVTVTIFSKDAFSKHARFDVTDSVLKTMPAAHRDDPRFVEARAIAWAFDAEMFANTLSRATSVLGRDWDVSVGPALDSTYETFGFYRQPGE